MSLRCLCCSLRILTIAKELSQVFRSRFAQVASVLSGDSASALASQNIARFPNRAGGGCFRSAHRETMMKGKELYPASKAVFARVVPVRSMCRPDERHDLRMNRNGQPTSGDIRSRAGCAAIVNQRLGANRLEQMTWADVGGRNATVNSN